MSRRSGLSTLTEEKKEMNECKCAVCEGRVADLKAWEQEMMEKYGWLQHYISEDPDLPCGINHHTHGLPRTYGHLDLQLVGPLEMEVGGGIFCDIVNRIRSGERFKDGDVLVGILQNGYLIKLIAAKECGRDVLRVILPDKKNRLDEERMDQPWVRQFACLDSGREKEEK
jgi:hypothetical protein